MGHRSSHPPFVAARRSRRLGRAATITLLILPLAVGCSGLFQSIGARMVTRELAEQFDLDEEQTAATRASIDRLIAAAPEVLGPRLKQLVDSTDQAIAEGLSEGNMIPIERQFDALADDVVARVIAEAAPILATLDDRQIAHAERRFQEQFSQGRKEMVKPAATRLEERQEDFVAGVEEWSGSLSDQQKKALRAHVAKLPDESAVRIAADEGRVQVIAETLRGHPGGPVVHATLWEAWKNRRDWGRGARPPEVRDMERRDTLTYVDGMFTEKQRDHAREHLQSLYRRVNRFLSSAGS